MNNNKPWLRAFGVAALAIGASAATLGGTLAAFPNAKQACQENRATRPFVAGSPDGSHRLVA